MWTWWTYDFGYMWPLTRGHALVCLIFGGLALVARTRGWPRWTTAASAAVAVWGLVGALVMHGVIRVNAPTTLPTANFLATGAGSVLDLGAGSGRATVMVLLERPRATVTGLDRYTGFYGIVDNTPERLLANARRAGVEDRLRVQAGDMRRLPFGDASFDGAVSVAAMDHLSRGDLPQALAETRRVLKPGGEFLFVTINSDAWVKLAVPWALHGHGYWGRQGNAAFWRDLITTAGFEVAELGTRPAELYVLARRPVTPAGDR